jgi:FkbM family methyltransferase
MRSTTVRRGWALIRVEGPVGAGRAIVRRLVRLSRRSHALSETELVADALLGNGQRTNGVMMDVGAHDGAVFADFAQRGWQVYAFEPDPKNRERIAVAFGRQRNVHVDESAVSDVSQADAAVFVSSQSSGISGLSAFDDSHEQAGVVTTVTIDDFVGQESIRNIGLFEDRYRGIRSDGPGRGFLGVECARRLLFANSRIEDCFTWLRLS